MDSREDSVWLGWRRMMEMAIAGKMAADAGDGGGWRTWQQMAVNGEDVLRCR